jgi:hypothetical protein
MYCTDVSNYTAMNINFYSYSYSEAQHYIYYVILVILEIGDHINKLNITFLVGDCIMYNAI